MRFSFMSGCICTYFELLLFIFLTVLTGLQHLSSTIDQSLKIDDQIQKFESSFVNVMPAHIIAYGYTRIALHVYMWKDIN